MEALGVFGREEEVLRRGLVGVFHSRLVGFPMEGSHQFPGELLPRGINTYPCREFGLYSIHHSSSGDCRDAMPARCILVVYLHT